MSFATATDRSIVRSVTGEFDALRLLALLSALVLTGSYLSVLFHVTDVVGGSDRLLAVVVGAFVAATVLARRLRPVGAFVASVLVLLVGNVLYLLSVPSGVAVINSIGGVAVDVVALLTGVSVLWLTGADVWAVGFAPAPVFLSWYLVLRERYVWCATVGGLALAVFVLTGDAAPLIVLAGALGATGVVGFGDLSRRGSTVARADVLAIVMAAMVLVTLTVSVVPGTAAQPLFSDREPTPTVEGHLVGTDDRLSIVGEVDLSPEVRFTIESEEPANWRVDAYDRYTGDGWIRSGESRPLDGTSPPGDARTVEVVVNVESETRAMPARWKPIYVDDVSGDVRSSSEDGLVPASSLDGGDRFRVVAERPDPSIEALRRAGTDYPDGITERYTQLPESTPDRVADYTRALTADVDTPYEMALVVERHLQEEKGYSLDVDRPAGDVADAFLFEMETGYCTYFATTMVAMLRTQDVPARLAVGYSTGERIDEDRWVVRGMNAHAWVEVYVPDVGWVSFDPTPSAAYDAARTDRLEQARADDVPGVDTEESGGEEWRPESTDDAGENDTTAGTDAGNVSNLSAAELAALADDEDPDDVWVMGDVDAGDAGGGSPLPPPETLAVWLVLFAGGIAGAHRVGLSNRLGYSLDVRWQGRASTPEDDVERAFSRLERLLANRYRPRGPGESVRAYLSSLERVGLDERAGRVGMLFELARYGPGVDEGEAAEAIALVDDLVADSTPVLGRMGRIDRRRGRN